MADPPPESAGTRSRRVTEVTQKPDGNHYAFFMPEPLSSDEALEWRDFRRTIKKCKRRHGKFPDSCRALFTFERRNG